jgi:CRP-like cAMP-binding protein
VIEKTLKRAEVFLGLDDSDLKMIADLPSSREESYEAGQVLFRAGAEAKYIYILEEGQVDIMVEVPSSAKKDSTQVAVDVITKGDVFGWSALVKPHLYVLSAVCQKPSKVTIINGAELITLFDRNCYIGYKVFQGLSQVIGSRFRDLERVLIIGKRWPFIEKHSGT